MTWDLVAVRDNRVAIAWDDHTAIVEVRMATPGLCSVRGAYTRVVAGDPVPVDMESAIIEAWADARWGVTEESDGDPELLAWLDGGARPFQVADRSAA